MPEPAWYDPDHDDPSEPPPFDVESARRWATPPVIAMGPPFAAWWCPVCERLQQDGHYLHTAVLTEQERAAGPVCPTVGIQAVRLTHRPPAAREPGLPLAGWWCPTCRYLVPDAAGSHPSRATRPARLDDCTTRRYRSVLVARR
jgi:hypothetical protein